jgi:hypothetical protein
LGRALFALSVAGLPLSGHVLARPGRTGGLLLEATSALLFARGVQLVLAGAPARLRPFPRCLAYAELFAFDVHAGVLSLEDATGEGPAQP